MDCLVATIEQAHPHKAKDNKSQYQITPVLGLAQIHRDIGQAPPAVAFFLCRWRLLLRIGIQSRIPFNKPQKNKPDPPDWGESGYA